MTDGLPWWDHRLEYDGDSARTRNYRRLQSRWRGVVLGLPPGTYEDSNGRVRALGSLLPTMATRQSQLLSQEAIWHAEARLPQLAAEGRKAEPRRLWTNMLSSQPMCFSIFGHLEAHRAAAARALDRVLPWPVERIDEVTLEYAPAAAASRLGGDKPDNTAFDTMLVVSGAGTHRVIGVETKYTEPFSQYEYDKPSYRAVTERRGTWFKPGAADALRSSGTNQLWRNVMLAQEASRDVTCEGSVLVLTASDDHGAERAVTGVADQLHDPDQRLIHVLLEDLMTSAAQEPALSDWAERFTERYLAASLADTMRFHTSQ